MLRVAIAISAAGGAFWASQDESGVFRGVTVDLAHALAADLGRTLQIVAYPNSNEITEDAARGAWDVTFIPMDATRAQKLDFGARTAAAVPRGHGAMLETVTAFLRGCAKDGRLRAILDANDMGEAEIPAELTLA